jgi:hypothetical protein
MNKNNPVIEIESARVIDIDKVPLSLRVRNLSYSTIYTWISHRALPLSRKNADKIYKTLGLPRDNQEYELMCITHGLSINDNFWIANETEVGRIKYEDINLFTNSLNKSLYLVALCGDDNFTITDKNISAEYTGQGTYPKCFIREKDGIYLYKSGPVNEITNEIYAGYIAQLIGFKSASYEYKKLNNIDCVKSKIITGLNENWESAFLLSEYFNDAFKAIPQDIAISKYTIEYSNMIIFDALVLNDDRHMKNWSFSIDANTNIITGIAHSYDYNKAFEADKNSKSGLLFDGYRKMSILSAAKRAYSEFGTSLRLDYLYNVLDMINIRINKDTMKNRILYIMGKKSNQDNCY